METIDPVAIDPDIMIKFNIIQWHLWYHQVQLSSVLKSILCLLTCMLFFFFTKEYMCKGENKLALASATQTARLCPSQNTSSFPNLIWALNPCITEMRATALP